MLDLHCSQKQATEVVLWAALGKEVHSCGATTEKTFSHIATYQISDGGATQKRPLPDDL